MAKKLIPFMPLAEAYKLLKSFGYDVWCFDPDAKYFEADSANGDSVVVYYSGNDNDLYVLKAF